jgi:hypothetical protein
MFFSPVTFEYSGARATVKPKDVLRLISVIEQSFDFRGAAASQSWPAATVAIGYAKVLNFVGLEQDGKPFTVDEVELAKRLYTHHSELQAIVENLAAIVSLIAPPEPEKPAETDKETPAPEQENTEKKD